MGLALEPLIKHLQKHIIKSGYVKAIDTTAQVLKTPGKKNKSQSYMWTYLTGNSERLAVVYDYQQTRHGQFAESFLTGFKGVLQTDGYSGYTCASLAKKRCVQWVTGPMPDANFMMCEPFQKQKVLPQKPLILSANFTALKMNRRSA